MKADSGHAPASAAGFKIRERTFVGVRGVPVIDANTGSRSRGHSDSRRASLTATTSSPGPTVPTEPDIAPTGRR